MAEIEYFYAAYSGYAYLGSKRLMAITNLSGHTIKHRPFDLRASMDAVGGQPLDERTEANLEYFFGRELERWSEFREVPLLNLLYAGEKKTLLEKQRQTWSRHTKRLCRKQCCFLS